MKPVSAPDIDYLLRAIVTLHMEVSVRESMLKAQAAEIADLKKPPEEKKKAAK